MLKSRRVRLLCLMLLVLGAAMVVLAVYRQRARLPGDAILRRQFDERREAFDQLRDTITSEPTLRGVGPGYLRARLASGRSVSYWLVQREWQTNDPTGSTTTPTYETALKSVGLSPQRHDMYARLLRIVDGRRVEWARSGRPDESVSVSLGAEGIVPSGQSKSIVFFPLGIPDHFRLVADTDDYAQKGDYYVSLEGGWYIHRQCW